ncbi:MAG: DMT family transporter [Candidatus Helarchaeota archaeon]
MTSEIINYIVGILLALLSTFMFNLGAVLQKKGTGDIGELKLSDAKSFVDLVKSRVWIVGMSIGILGGIPYMLAQDMVGVTLAQPLQGVGILVLTIFAVRWLKESLKVPEKIGVVLLIVSPIFISLGQVSAIQISIFDPAIFLPLIIFYSIFLSIIAITFILYKISTKGIPIIIATTAGVFFGIGAISSQLGVEGIIGPLLGNTQINWGLGLFGLFFVIIGNLFATMYIQIAYQKGKAVSVVPVANTGNLLIPIIGGMLIFGQTIGNLFFFILGVISMFVGVTLLARVQGEMQQKEDVDKIQENKEVEM